MLRRQRTKQPSDFDALACLACFNAVDLSAAKQRAAAEKPEPFFDRNWQVSVDKRCLYTNRHLCTELLLANSTAVVNKKVVVAALSQWSSNNDDILTSGKPPNYLNDAMYTVMQMLSDVKELKRNSTTLARRPPWLSEILKLVDTPVGHGEIKQEKEEP